MVRKMDYELLEEKVGRILLNHGMKEVYIKGRKNYIIEKEKEKEKEGSPHYLRLCHWDRCIQIECADNYNEALLGVYEDTEGVSIPISMFPPEEAEQLSETYRARVKLTEYDFYSIFQMYIVEFYKKNCLMDRLKLLGYDRSTINHRIVYKKNDIICDIDYDINISKVVCKITSNRGNKILEYDYEQAFYLCESVTQELEEYMKI